MSLYEYVKTGRFPHPFDLGVRNVAWVEVEVEDWIQQRIAKRRDATYAWELPMKYKSIATHMRHIKRNPVRFMFA
ncbi:helix-turn-helix transcriptional regulator [Gayadomonas joobiniege]|uniref:helix-turn-helix transcriptional regulator n=1 Tax=Gayadomonas joobiniege TaxID=1234606 RepID=UPI00036C4F6A|nr:AlpA family phage regulatory protein [Gayadomonas joobiniege]